jgi:uncharacterized damage-inducible protein DinB
MFGPYPRRFSVTSGLLSVVRVQQFGLQPLVFVLACQTAASLRSYARDSMREIDRILDQMDRAFSGDAWHGPSLMSLLQSISAEDASKHPIKGAHSIWELANHLSAWNAITSHRLQGEEVQITTERDWPPVWEVSETAWRRALEILAESHAHLRSVVSKLKDDELDQKAAGPNYSRYVVIHGVIQHNLYHAGQIAVLKKAL